MYVCSCRSVSSISRQRGFTLQELVVTLTIAATLTSIGAGIRNILNDNAMTAAANDLVTQLAIARTEAITHHISVVLCPSKDQRHCADAGSDYTYWQYGWLLYGDRNRNRRPEPDEIVRVQSDVSGNFAIRTSKARRAVTYHPIGTSGGSTITFAICDTRGKASARYITVSNTGRARVSRTTKSSIKCTLD